MTNDRRLIEVAFPLQQASLDSVHEKNVRHGHISTLHIWPARRPLAASRAALIATLLPDPGTPAARAALVERIGGKLTHAVKRERGASGKMVEREVVATEGGVLHWGQESSADMDYFRAEIRKAYGGRAPRVMDPFAGGGALPLEAMRLGCEVTAVDINPVAWFILKCTLEYPQKLAGQTLPLPDFAQSNPAFMENFYKAQGHGKKSGRGRGTQGVAVALPTLDSIDADLAWHVRAWGMWVLERARQDLATYYPTIDGKATVAYLWARTVQCKQCRATLPLLKTRWLCKKENKRVVLTMAPNAEQTGVIFGVQADAPVLGGNNAQRRENDKRLGAGTMSRSGATCPCCGQIMTMEDIRQEGMAGRLDAVMTAVVVDGTHGKEYRLPESAEVQMAAQAQEGIAQVFAGIPFGVPDEEIREDAKRNTWCLTYGADRFSKLFTYRQLYALGVFVSLTRSTRERFDSIEYPSKWSEAIQAYLAVAIDRLADYSSSVCSWHNSAEKLRNTFGRFALPLTWDYTEVLPFSEMTGGYLGAIEWICRYIARQASDSFNTDKLTISQGSAIKIDKKLKELDLIITDPPYYDAIGYSILMDFFYVWLRRSLYGISPEIDHVFQNSLAPKWDHSINDGELIDDSSRFGGNKTKSKAAYEDGMFRAFQACHAALNANGRLVIVFAHKQPDAWETLVSAIIRAGFVVDGSWPIQTEMGNRTRALSSAALSSSVWLVCKKRPETARPGWDNRVLDEMHTKIAVQLHEFWDAGIRGPDFVWAATGPALAAYSQYPIVKKANDPGAVMTVAEFLRQVRRMVVDYVVGIVLKTSAAQAEGELDSVTIYYLLHRNDYKMVEAPIGVSILYATSCGVSDADLVTHHDLLQRKDSTTPIPDVDDDLDDDVAEDAEDVSASKGSTVKLKPWDKRNPRMLRDEIAIDRLHKLMAFWKAGDIVKVDAYIDHQGIRRSDIFRHLIQAIIELAGEGNDERATLESISNHLDARGAAPQLKYEQMTALTDE